VKTEGAGVLVGVQGVTKQFTTLDTVITAVDEVSLEIEVGSIVALTGASGSGKSTLLHLLGALDIPDAGTTTVTGGPDGDQDLTKLNRKQLAAYRRGIGFVFQQFNLLPTLTVIDNVTVPLIPLGKPSAQARDRARQLLADVGLPDRDHTLATRLSGGQQQRVAIARALINQPRLVLADEPTGNLDSTTASQIIDLLLGLRDTHGTTLVIATHDPDFAARCDRSITIRDGRIHTDTPTR